MPFPTYLYIDTYTNICTSSLVSGLTLSRVKDWLWGITPTQPTVGDGHDLPGAFESEYILSVYHLINWSKDHGGAGITPGHGKWENVKSIFPIHNQGANRALLLHLSKRLLLRKEDLDQIRDLFGSKVAFYFAFMQTYFLFLFFPAVTGVLAWLFLPKYSLAYAILTLFGCTVFLEYWKIQQADLSMRWNVKGVESLKINRPRFRYEKTVRDAAGRVQFYFPVWKSLLRQLVQVPFFIVALLGLGSMIAMVFTLETLISEAYEGPYKSYLVRMHQRPFRLHPSGNFPLADFLLAGRGGFPPFLFAENRSTVLLLCWPFFCRTSTPSSRTPPRVSLNSKTTARRTVLTSRSRRSGRSLHSLQITSPYSLRLLFTYRLVTVSITFV